MQFPNYNTAVVDSKNLIVMPVAIPDTINYKPKAEKEEQVG